MSPGRALPVGLLLLVVVAALSVLAGVGTRPFGSLDRTVAADVSPAVDGTWLEPASVLLSRFGAPVPLILLGLLLAAGVGFAHARRPRQALGAVLLLALAPTVAWQLDVVLKVLIASPRPDLAPALVEAGGYGMPSGHATTSAALATAVALAVPPVLPRRWLRTVLVTAAVLGAVLVGLSRITLGVHWASDVVGGWALGVGIVLVLAVAFRRPPADRDTG